jgi:hypothetical protein
MNRIRVVTPEESHYRQPHYCQAGSCGEHTKDQKPFCRFHVTQSAYAQKILAKIAKNAKSDT